MDGVFPDLVPHVKFCCRTSRKLFRRSECRIGGSTPCPRPATTTSSSGPAPPGACSRAGSPRTRKRASCSSRRGVRCRGGSGASGCRPRSRIRRTAPRTTGPTSPIRSRGWTGGGWTARAGRCSAARPPSTAWSTSAEIRSTTTSGPGSPASQHWSYRHCLPYFRKAETRDTGPDSWHGGDGPLPVTRSKPVNPLFEAFVESGVEAGYERTDDLNGYRQEGFGPMDRTTWRGRRGGAAFFYLAPALSRSNLEVRTRVLVSRIVVEGRRATGIELAAPGGGVERIHAERAVVCCAGAIDSPRILQRSGIGDPDFLRRRRRGDRGTPGRRRQPPGPPRDLRPVPLEAAGLALSGAQALEPARDRRALAPHRHRHRRVQPLRGGRLRAFARRPCHPQPAVPLRPHRDELRRAQPRRRARVPDARGADEGDEHRSRAHPFERPARSPVDRLQLPHHGVRPGGHARRGQDLARDRRPASVRALTAARRSRPAPACPTATTPSTPGWGRRHAESAYHPIIVHLRGDGIRRTTPGRSPTGKGESTGSRGCGWWTRRSCRGSSTATSTRPRSCWRRRSPTRSGAAIRSSRRRTQLVPYWVAIRAAARPPVANRRPGS